MIRRAAVVAAAAMLVPAVAQAQTTPAADVYPAEYFQRFNPTTAEDMVRQTPGFSIDQGDRVRGFGGAAGNVLINGERPSTKESISDLLRRIPADSVERVEIVTVSSTNWRDTVRVFL